jgi:hypothetical protein
MATRSDAVVAKKRKQVAAGYARRGYRVMQPGAGTVPSFLRDCQPDLIAEKEDDHVVIEIKPTSALKGSNDLTELAARIAGQPGWRLELVALGREGTDAAILSTPDWLEQMLQRPQTFADPSLDRFYVGYLFEVLEYLINGVASLNKIRSRGKSAQRVAHELAFAGTIEQDVLDRVEVSLGWRDNLMQRQPIDRSPQDQAAEITALCRDIYARYVGDSSSPGRQ